MLYRLNWLMVVKRLSQLLTACVYVHCILVYAIRIEYNKGIHYVNTYPKGRALKQMYRVVPETKRGNKQRFRVQTHSVTRFTRQSVQRIEVQTYYKV